MTPDIYHVRCFILLASSYMLPSCAPPTRKTIAKVHPPIYRSQCAHETSNRATRFGLTEHVDWTSLALKT